MKIRIIATAAIISLTGVWEAQPQVPSYDCQKAQTAAEKMICRDPKLATLDAALAQEIRNTLKNRPEMRATVLAGERDWVSQRDQQCASTGEDSKLFHGCLEAQYSARLTELRSVGASPTAIAGVYKVADAWPTGQGEAFQKMRSESRPICMAVRRELAQRSDSGPLVCGSPFYKDPAVERPTWASIDNSKLSMMAERLEFLIMESFGRRIDETTTKAVTRQVSEQIRAGALSISTTTVRLAVDKFISAAESPQNQKTTILRYVRWGCADEDKPLLYSRVYFFKVDNSDLLDLKQLSAHGLPDDLILIDGSAYFTDRSERFVDSHWRQLPKSQPEFTVHQMATEPYLEQICELLYWDKSNSPIDPVSVGK